MDAVVAADAKRDFTLEDLIHILRECYALLQIVSNDTPQNQWLVIYEVHQIIYNVVVTNTCLDLYGFNKIAKYYDVSHFPPEQWITVLSQYCKAFLQDAGSELQTYGNY